MTADETPAPDPADDPFVHISPAECPDGPHRGPEGPNEDIAQCPRCWRLSWCLRPEGETYGWHDPDCSLPARHESYCRPGGDGHPVAAKIRGYWPGSEQEEVDRRALLGALPDTPGEGA